MHSEVRSTLVTVTTQVRLLKTVNTIKEDLTVK